MSQFSDKVTKLMKEQNKKPSDFVKAFGVNPSAVTHWIKGRRQPDFDTLKMFSKFLGVTTDYLLDNNIKPINIKTDFVTIPVLNWVQAGEMTDIMEIEPIDYISVPCDLKNCFALQVTGRSMLPDFKEDDVLIIDPERQPVTGNYVIASTENNEKATFKKYLERYNEDGTMYFELKPLNPDFPSFNSKQFNIIIKGVVVNYIRKVL